MIFCNAHDSTSECPLQFRMESSTESFYHIHDRPSQELEIMMTTIVTQPVRKVRKTPTSPVSGRPFLAPVGDAPHHIVRPKDASRAAKKDVRKCYVDPTICEGAYAAAELEFMKAMQEYKRSSGRLFPTWSEVLEVLQNLGYEKPASDGSVLVARFAAGKGTKLESSKSQRGVSQPAA
jgi:hypothetical protein